MEQGQIILEISADTSGLEPAYKALNKIGQISDEQLKQFLDDTAKIQANLNSTGEKAAGSFKKLNEEIKNVGKTSQTVLALDKSKDVMRTVASVGSLKQQLREATIETQKLTQQYGALDSRTLEAANKAARLSNEIKTVNEQISALNPQAKFNAIIQLASGAAGAFAGLQGAMSLFTDQTEEAKKSAEKFQNVIALAVGLNSILSLKDGFTNLKSALGLSTTATIAQRDAEIALTASEAAATAGAEAQTIAQAEQTAATEAGVAANKALTTSFLATPYGMVIAAVTAIAGAYLLFRDNATAAEKAQEKIANNALKAVESTQEELVHVQSLINIYGQSNTSLKTRQNILNELNGIAPAYFESLDAENTKVGTLIGQYTVFAKVLTLKAQAEGLAKIISDKNNETLEKTSDVLSNNTSKVQGFLQRLAQSFSGIPILFDTQTKKQLDLIDSSKKNEEEVKLLTKAYEGLLKQLDELTKKEKPSTSGKEVIDQLKKNAEEAARIAEQQRKRELSDDLANLKVWVSERKKQIAESFTSDAEKESELTKLQGVELNLRKMYYEQYGEDVRGIIADINDYEAALSQKLAVEMGKSQAKALADVFGFVQGQKQEQAKDEVKSTEDLERQKQDLRISIAQETAAAIVDIFNATTDNEIADFERLTQNYTDNLDRQLNKNKEDFDQRKINSKTYYAEEKRLQSEKVNAEKLAQSQINDLKRKQDVGNRLQKLFEVAIATARNIAETPLLAAFYTTLGAIQTAAILAAPLPKYAKGTLSLKRGNNRPGIDTIPILANEGEAITPTDKARMYRPTLEAIHKGSIPAMRLNDFVRSFNVKELSSSKSGMVVNNNIDIDYDELAYKIRWAMRDMDSVKIKNLGDLAQILDASNDIRRIRN